MASRRLQTLLELGREHDASDIILSPGTAPGMRVAGILRPIQGEAVRTEEVEAALAEMVDANAIDLFRRTRELDFGAQPFGQRIRGNAFYSKGTPCLAIRRIPNEVPAPGHLGLPPILVDLIQKRQGLLLFTGAAGQGKSTTQASLIDWLNRHQPRHIVTIEDPIEFVLSSHASIIEQREVGRDTAGFAPALKHVMRQNPDVIQIGEIRDLETIQAALTVAETGHLVVSTLHANDACQAVDRIVDFFPRDKQTQVRTQLSLTLLAIVSQRLVRDKAQKLVLACEILLNNSAIAKLIRSGKTEQLYSAIQIDPRPGAKTMNAALQELVDAGTVHIAEARPFMTRLESQAIEED